MQKHLVYGGRVFWSQRLGEDASNLAASAASEMQEWVATKLSLKRSIGISMFETVRVHMRHPL